MKRTIHTKLVFGLLPGLFFLLLIGGVGYISLSNALQAADGLLQSALETARTGNDPIMPPEVVMQSQLQHTVAEIVTTHQTAGRILLLSTLMALCGGAIFTYFFSRSLSRPIVALSQGAHRIGEGDLTYRLNIQSNDEIGELAKAFNHMADQLQESYTTLENRVAERTRELAVVNAVASTVNESLNLTEILDRALDKILKATGLARGGIWVLEEGDFCLQAAQGLSPEFVAERGHFHWAEASEVDGLPWQIPMATTSTEPTTQKRSLNELDNPAKRGSLGNLQIVPELGVKLCCNDGAQTILAVPIKAREKVVGMIGVGSHEPEVTLPQFAALLSAIGQQIGFAIENARLYVEEQRQRQLADTLRHISRSLVSSLNLDEVLSGILEQIGQVLVVDAGLILLVEGNWLKVAAVRGRSELGMDKWLGYTFESQTSPYLDQVVRDKEPMTFCEPNRTTLFQKGIDRIEEVQWCLVVPLLQGEQVIGLLTLEQIGHCYEQGEEARTALAFANHAALAIDNARLYTRVQQFNSELEAQVQERTFELTQAHNALDRQARQLRELYHRTVEVQEAERDRIAHEIHDGVTQWTLGVLYELEAAKVCWHSRPEAALGKVAAAQETLKGIKTEMYRVIHNLHPPFLESDGLLSAIKTYAADYQAINNLLCRVEVKGLPQRLAATQELAIYRIVQEALRNIVTHAQASRVQVLLSFEPEQVTVQVTDNGQGFDLEQITDQQHPHLGLIGMRERAQSVGGRLIVRSTPRLGTTISLSLPVNIHQGEYMVV